MRLNKSLAFLILGRFIQAVLAIATMKLATHFLSPKEMGNYYVLSSIATLFGITLISPIGQFVNRKFHSWHDQKLVTSRLITYNYYVLLVSLLAIPIIFIAKFFFGFMTDIPFFEVIFLSATSIYFNTWFNTLVPALNMLEKRTSFTVFTIANLAGSLMFSVLFVILHQAKGTYWYLGQYVAFQAIVTCFALWHLKKVVSEDLRLNFLKFSVSSSQIRSVMAFSAPLIVATFFMWLLNDSYRFIVEKMLGLEVLGNLAVGLSISASIFALLESLFQQIYYPKFYRSITNATPEERLQACQDLIDTAFPAFCFTALFLASSSPFILRILTSINFSNSYIFVIFGCGISLARVLTNIISTIAHSELNTKKLIFPYAFGGGLTVVLMTSLLSIYHSQYVIGLVLLFCNFLVLFFMKKKMFNIVKANIPWHELGQIFLFSLPFYTEVFFWEKNDLMTSFIVMAIFGIYYSAVLFKKFASTVAQP